MTPPNAISLARLLLVPVFVWLLFTEREEAAFWVFVAAGISDAIDGFLAKRFGMASRIGAFLDPIADKTLLVTAFISLGLLDLLPLWLVILVVSRDLLIVGGALLFATVNGRLDMQPLPISKLNTALQMATVIVALAHPMFAVPPAVVVTWLGIVTGVSTAVSGTIYVIIWSRRASHTGGSAAESPGKDRR